MSKEKNKEPVGRILDSDRRFRWAILFCLTILFCLILFPSWVTTKHQYDLGDVAERDIKSPRDFFIEDQAATALNRQRAEAKVLTLGPATDRVATWRRQDVTVGFTAEYVWRR